MLNFYENSIHVRLPALKLITEQKFWLLIWLMIQQKLACKNMYFWSLAEKGSCIMRFLVIGNSYWQFF